MKSEFRVLCIFKSCHAHGMVTRIAYYSYCIETHCDLQEFKLSYVVYVQILNFKFKSYNFKILKCETYGMVIISGTTIIHIDNAT